MPFDSSQGIKFKFNGNYYTATSISVSKSAGEINATGLDIPAGSTATSRYRPGGLMSVELKVDWIGADPPAVDDVYPLVIEGSGPGSGTALWGGPAAGNALCTGLSITAQAGELIKGSATFKLSVD